VETSPRVVRKEIVQPAKLRRPSTSHRKCFRSPQKCRISLPAGTNSSASRRLMSNAGNECTAKAHRLPRSHHVVFHLGQFPQVVLDPGNLYGFPTARGTSQNQSGSNPKRFLPVRSRILRALPLARATIPGKSDFMLVLNTSVWLEEKFSFCDSRFVVKQ
jgi:hypothetical protein